MQCVVNASRACFEAMLKMPTVDYFNHFELGRSIIDQTPVEQLGNDKLLGYGIEAKITFRVKQLVHYHRQACSPTPVRRLLLLREAV
jgi:hypothetical protein